MSPEEFMAALAALVGPGRGILRRGARLLGVSEGMVRQIASGLRPVPASYVVRLRAVEADSDARGAWVPFLAPRLQGVVSQAVKAGCSERDAWSAVAACAALRLSGIR